MFLNAEWSSADWDAISFNAIHMGDWQALYHVWFSTF